MKEDIQKIELKNIGELRNFSVAEIAYSIYKCHRCDPDVAIIAAYYTYKRKNPKNWSSYRELIGNKMDKIIRIPIIKEEWTEQIFKVYKYNRLSGYKDNWSVLPIR